MIPLVSLVMHWRVFPLDLMSIHVWRQTQTQSTIVNFYEEDFNILNPRVNDRGEKTGIRRMEFPIMQWAFAAVYKVFGNHVIISRLLTFLISLFSIWGMFELLRWLLRSELAGLIAAWALTFSPSFFYYSVNPLPDNLSLATAIWGLALYYRYREKSSKLDLVLSAILISVSVASKLPFVLIGAIPLTYTVRHIVNQKKIPWAMSTYLIMMLPTIAWYAWVMPGWKQSSGVLEGSLGVEADAADTFGNLFGNLTSVLPELLLNFASVPLFLAGLYFLFKSKVYKHPRFPELFVLFVALVLFYLYILNLIGTGHDYYFFPFMPLLFVAVTYGALKLLSQKDRRIHYFVMLCLIVLPLTCMLRMNSRWNPESPGFNKDLLIHKNDLRQAVPDKKLCVVGTDGSHFIWHYYLHKKGWTFEEEKLTGKRLGKMIDRGGEYMYSDSRKIENDPGIQPYLGELILEKGSVKVFKLKKLP